MNHKQAVGKAKDSSAMNAQLECRFDDGSIRWIHMFDVHGNASNLLWNYNEHHDNCKNKNNKVNNHKAKLV